MKCMCNMLTMCRFHEYWPSLIVSVREVSKRMLNNVNMFCAKEESP